MDVSVIFVNYNTISLLKAAVDSVFEHTKNIQFEIIVVDNNSNDNSEIILKKHYGDKIRYMKLSENIGFGRANNKGMEIAKGRNILFLNPDTILLNNALKFLSDFLDHNENAGACGGNLYQKDLSPNFSFMRATPGFLTELNFLTKNFLFRVYFGKSYEFNFTEKPLKVAYVTGADMMVKASVLKETGGFDPDFFMYYEETELSNRINQKGYSIYSIPQAKIIHLEGGSFSCNVNGQERALKSRRIYMQKKYKNKVLIYLININYFFICLMGMAWYFTKKDKEKVGFWKYSIKNFNSI
ncbi:MAG: glycosyltransferase family 2 protein [Prevotellaceae bacterium]|jgi:GT2 family glycosyltransferase|nr:glycosyltransferase family 2 protein [Prevotellaceae bacterium]